MPGVTMELDTTPGADAASRFVVDGTSTSVFIRESCERFYGGTPDLEDLCFFWVRVPPGQGRDVSVRVYSGTQLSPAVTIDYAKPTMTSIEVGGVVYAGTSRATAAVLPARGEDIVLHGHNFGTKATVTFGDAFTRSVCSASAVANSFEGFEAASCNSMITVDSSAEGAARITVRAPPGQGAYPELVVTVDHGVGYASTPLRFKYEMPMITQVVLATEDNDDVDSSAFGSLGARDVEVGQDSQGNPFTNDYRMP